jgi:hypothetical protein
VLLLLLLQALKAMGVDEGDRNFGCEVPVEAQAYWWHNRCDAHSSAVHAAYGVKHALEYRSGLLPRAYCSTICSFPVVVAAIHW